MSDNRKMTAAQVATQLEGWAAEYRIIQKDEKQPKWMRERADASAEAYEHSAKMIRENLAVKLGGGGLLGWLDRFTSEAELEAHHVLSNHPLNRYRTVRGYSKAKNKWLSTTIGVLILLTIACVTVILLV